MIGLLCILPVLSASTWKPIPLLDSLTTSELRGISADGKTVVGIMHSSDKDRAFKWTEASGSKNLGELSWDLWHSANGLRVLTDDGDLEDPLGVDAKNMRWARTVSLMQDASMPKGTYTTVWATGSTGDKAIKIGRGISKRGTEAVIWVGKSDPVGLGDLAAGVFYSQANGLSADGKWVTGSSSSKTGQTAYIWSRDTGMKGLAMPKNRPQATAGNCVSLDRRVVGGESVTDTGLRATLWFADGKVVYVDEYLESIGVKVEEKWRLRSVQCISDNGETLAGLARSDTGVERVWIATIPKN